MNIVGEALSWKYKSRGFLCPGQGRMESSGTPHYSRTRNIQTSLSPEKIPVRSDRGGGGGEAGRYGGDGEVYPEFM